KDDTGASLAGVTIEATSPARIGGAAVQVTDAQGLYQLENLPIGQYTVTFTLQGFSTVRRDDIRVEVGRTVQADISMKVGAVEQAITVIGQSPVVDALHAGVTTNFNSELLANVPTARQSYFDVVTFAPSVRINAVPNDSRFVIMGSSSDQNSFQYDGVDISAVSNGGVWDFPSPDIMQEVEVKTTGASAEYFNFQGGVVNIVTKSGSNTLHGIWSGYDIPHSWVGNNTPNEKFPYDVHFSYQTTFELGGPILKDRVWFYGIAPYARALTTGVGVDPGLPTNAGWTFKPFFKVTSKPATNDGLDFTFDDNRFCCGAAASRTAPIYTQTVEHGHNPIVAVHYTHTFGSATLFEAKGGGIYIRDNFTPFSDDFVTPQHAPDLATGLTTGNGRTGSRQVHNRTTVDVSLAHSASDLGSFLKGSHDFKAGFQTQYATQQTNTLTFGNVTYTDLNGAPFQATFQDPQVLGGRIRQYGAYGQDNWTVNDRLTLNLGVRFDYTKGDIQAMDSQTTLIGINTTAPSAPTNIGYPGVPDLIAFKNASPRLGMTLRLDQSGRTVLKGNYGRFYGKLATAMFNSISPGNTPQETDKYDPATGRYDILQSLVNNQTNFAVDPGLRNQYTDQLFVGIERQLMASMGIDFEFVYKKEGNFIRMIDARGTYAPVVISAPLPDGTTVPLTVFNRTSPSSQSLFEVVNRADFTQDFKSLVFQLNKRFSTSWQALASYTYQKSDAFGTGILSGNTQQDFSTLSSTGGFGRTPNDIVNGYGPTATNSPSSIKLSTTYRAPFDVNLGLRYSYEEGRPYGPLINVLGLSQGAVQNVLDEPRGTFTLPATNDLQIRIDKDFTISQSQRLRASIDVFNLLNAATVLTLNNNVSTSTAANPFGQTLTIVRPRTLQLGVRYQF
ncbi:MAG TPA: TonB-dependent receptor, partial [Vicinamibacterales bacterium]|nr:TonB-dependent receptor [Vicinamibacterales bacterium]